MQNPKSKGRDRTTWIVRIATATATLAGSALTFAQSCPMCYNAAAASKAGAVHALRSGVLILLIPPVLISMGIFLMALRGRDRFNDPSDSDSLNLRELSRTAKYGDDPYL